MVRSVRCAVDAVACAEVDSIRPIPQHSAHSQHAADSVVSRKSGLLRPAPRSQPQRSLYVGVTILLCDPSRMLSPVFSLDGLMTPPDSPDKISRGQADFHPVLDMRGKPVVFDLRQGLLVNNQVASMPAIHHSVNRMVINIGGFYNIEIVSRGVPTMYDFVTQLGQALQSPVDARSTRLSLLGRKCVCVGLTLRSLDRGVAYCDLHLRNSA